MAGNSFCCRMLVVTAVALVTAFHPLPAQAALLSYDGFGVGGGPADYLVGDDSLPAQTPSGDKTRPPAHRFL